MISFDDFKKVEIRLGKVISAERVPETDKLIRLEVDLGDEKRQIVSGIAEYTTPEDLVGRTFPFVTNLEPRIIKGLESNGMILAASNDAGFSFLEPSSAIAPGTRIG
ncbi:MAG: methionine--tRNA ligase subunit beta [Candidatus Pacebacteria bacterium]|nr:methionine--tRNA ligase subunit beta [Candidatus Paceibacterota bacterium]